MVRISWIRRRTGIERELAKVRQAVDGGVHVNLLFPSGKLRNSSLSAV